MALRLDPTISWGDIGMGAGLLLTGVIAFTDLSARVTVQDARLQSVSTGTNEVHNELRVHIQQEATEREAMRQELRTDLREINVKLDRLIERETQHK